MNMLSFPTAEKKLSRIVIAFCCFHVVLLAGSRPYPTLVPCLFPCATLLLSLAGVEASLALPTTTTSSSSSSSSDNRGPFPSMPSSTFFSLAKSQFELLSLSIQWPCATNNHKQIPERRCKIKSIALYLPQENPNTGQLEFMPSIVYPSHPKSERIFIASDAQSGLAPTIPPTFTQLPGFSHASALLPAYPFTAGSSEGGSGTVGVLEEVFCDIRSPGKHSCPALSLPLFSGPQTIGILLVWGADDLAYSKQGFASSSSRSSRSSHSTIRSSSSSSSPYSSSSSSSVESAPSTPLWSQEDKYQITRVGETLALALCMDTDRFQSRVHSEKIRVAMADSLHQVKNPVQALRTFSKLLQRNLATQGKNGKVELARLVDDIVIQSERVVDLLTPFDHILNSMDENETKNLNSYQRLLAPMERSELVLRSSSSRKQAMSPVVKNNNLHNNSHLQLLSPNHAKESDTAKSNPIQDNRNRDNKDLKLDLKMSFVSDVLGSVFSSYKIMAEDLGIAMEIVGDGEQADLPGVSINPKLLQEAVTNVLDNAMKYVSYGMNGVCGVKNSNPKIRVTLQSNDDTEPPGVTILVEDNGPGIPEKERNMIFQRGYRGIYTDSLTHGSGIGLHISQEMISQMGGTLEVVDNQPQHLRGTVMRFILYRKPRQGR